MNDPNRVSQNRVSYSVAFFYSRNKSWRSKIQYQKYMGHRFFPFSFQLTLCSDFQGKWGKFHWPFSNFWRRNKYLWNIWMNLGRISTCDGRILHKVLSFLYWISRSGVPHIHAVPSAIFTLCAGSMSHIDTWNQRRLDNSQLCGVYLE